MQEIIVWIIVGLCAFFIGRKFWRQWRGLLDGRGGCCSDSSCCCASQKSVAPFPQPTTREDSDSPGGNGNTTNT